MKSIDDYHAGCVGRRDVLRGMIALGGGLVVSGCAMMRSTSEGAGSGRMTGGKMSVRWLGGGVAELATPDYKQIAYLDAWVWNNGGWSRFNVQKPPEYATKDGFVQYVSAKKPDAIFVLLTHDHGDHIGDYFEMLKALTGAGLPVQTVGQSDLMRKGLVDDFKAAGVDAPKVVMNAGNAINFGGAAKHGEMVARMVPAVHSSLHGFPPVGYMLDIGGVRAYLSGDTDLFGDMKVLGERYKPNVAILCVGNGPFTMSPQDAALACQWLGVSHAVPVHFAHNNLVMGTGASEEFQRALKSIAPGVTAHVMKPGDTIMIQT